MIRLTKEQAEKIGYLKITDWYAIQPIEIKDGSFILPERVIKDIENFKVNIKIKIAEKVFVSILDNLKAKTIIPLLSTELEITEVEPIKEIIIKK